MRKRLLFVAVLIALASAVHGQGAVDAHIEAVGGSERLAALESIERTARATVSAQARTFRGTFREVYDLVADRGATTLRTPVFLVRSGWDGDSGWRDHSIQGFRELDPAALALAKMSSSPSIIESVVRTYGAAAVRPLEDCVYEGVPCSVVRFVGSSVEILVSKESHLILSVVVPDVMAYHFGDYEQVDGIQLPGRATVQIPAQGLTVRYDYTNTTFNGKLKDRLFKRPR